MCLCVCIYIYIHTYVCVCSFFFPFAPPIDGSQGTPGQEHGSAGRSFLTPRCPVASQSSSATLSREVEPLN